MKIKKVLKILGIIIVILIILILIHTIRNYIIIRDLQNKFSQYSGSSNYYIKSVSTESSGTIVTTEYYQKNNKQAIFLKKDLNGETSKISMYNNGERTDIFWDNEENKTAQLDSGTTISMNIYNYLETDNNWQTFLGCLTSRIKSTSYNGKDCYLIKGFMSSTSLTSEDAEIYIDKGTGLFIKTNEAGIVNEREYEFDNVDDSIFEEPDISQYTIKK